jgi:3-isopropylmalate/(R)-2-methylmalate dehydratase small subunit
MLPIILDEKQIKELAQYSDRKENIEINLNEQEIRFGNNKINFEIEPFRKKCLLEGLDDIALSLIKSEQIDTYENMLKRNKPWIN